MNLFAALAHTWCHHAPLRTLELHYTEPLAVWCW